MSISIELNKGIYYVNGKILGHNKFSSEEALALNEFIKARKIVLELKRINISHKTLKSLIK